VALSRPADVQLHLPYCFIADEMVYITQLSAFMHYRPDPLPGTIFGGRFPVSVWPRPLMWAFEWHEPQKDIILKRGEPLFYVPVRGDGPLAPGAGGRGREDGRSCRPIWTRSAGW
jgi:hypothetical protein